MGLIENRQGLYAARWFLGIAEAGVYLDYYIELWHD
jgi:hypothetical protein